MNVKHIGLATFAAALLLSATAFAEPHHGGGGGAPHPGGAPHVGGGGAPHFGGGAGGAPHFGGGGTPHGGGGFEHGGAGFSHGGGMASFRGAPSHSFGAAQHSFGSAEHSFSSAEHRGGFASYSHRSEVRSNTATYHAFNRGAEVRGSSATLRSERGHGMEAPRGSTEANYAHAHGAYGSMEHAGMQHGAVATGGGPQHYARDSRGFGTRPSNWNHRPHNFDRGNYQRNVRASDRFHYGAYNAPRGYHYQRWTYGEYLPSMYWSRNYWLTSWWMFDLPVPPYGYEWVRYGDDALLVNVYTGQILQVDYGVFY